MKREEKTKAGIEIIPIAAIPAKTRANATQIGPGKAARHSNGGGTRRSMAPVPKVKVLIVDQDHSIAEKAAAILASHGYECCAVHGGESAIACAEEFTPDVVLCDVMLGDMNGVDACMQIQKQRSSCRILLLSEQVPVAHSLMQDAREQGYRFELLAKPMHPAELVAKISNLFGGAYSPAPSQSRAVNL